MNHAVAEITDSAVDQDWLRFCDTGSKDALAGILETHGHSMRAVALRVTRSHSDADDAVQMAVERLLEIDRTSLDGVRHARAWLLGVTMNCARQLIKHETTLRARHQRAQEQEPSAAEQCFEYDDEPDEQQELLRQVDASLQELPINYQEPVMLHYLHGMQFRDVGEALGRSEEAVKKQAQRGIKKLRDILRRRGVPVAMTLLIGLLSKLEAAHLSESARITSMVACLRAGHAFPATVPQFVPVAPGTIMNGLLIKLFILVLCIAAIVWALLAVVPQAEQQRSNNTSSVRVDESTEQLAINSDTVKHQWRYIGFNDVSASSGILEQFGDIPAGNASDFKRPDAEGDINQPMWYVDSQDQQTLLSLTLKQGIQSPIYELRYQYRVKGRQGNKSYPFFGLLMRASALPAKREIKYMADAKSLSSLLKQGQWHQVHIRIEALERDGEAWSRMLVRVNDHIYSDVQIQIPSNHLFTPFATIGLKIELSDLQIRELAAEL